MDNRQYTGDSAYSVESIRAYEVSRLLNKLLSLSPEQMEAIENLSRSLVEELLAALTEFLAPYRDDG